MAQLDHARRLLSGEAMPLLPRLFGSAQHQAAKKIDRVLRTLLPKEALPDHAKPEHIAAALASQDSDVSIRLRANPPSQKDWRNCPLSLEFEGSDRDRLPILGIDLSYIAHADAAQSPSFPLIIGGHNAGSSEIFFHDKQSRPHALIPISGNHGLATPHAAIMFFPKAATLEVWALPTVNSLNEQGAVEMVIDGMYPVAIKHYDRINLLEQGGAVLLNLAIIDKGGTRHNVAGVHVYMDPNKQTMRPRTAAEYRSQRVGLLPDQTVTIEEGALHNSIYPPDLLKTIPHRGVYALVRRHAINGVKWTSPKLEVRFHRGNNGVTPEALFLDDRVSAGEELMALGTYTLTEQGLMIDGKGQTHTTTYTSILHIASSEHIARDAGIGDAAYNIGQMLQQTKTEISTYWQIEIGKIEREKALGGGVDIVRNAQDVQATLLMARLKDNLRFALVTGKNLTGHLYTELRVATGYHPSPTFILPNAGQSNSPERIIAEGTLQKDDEGIPRAIINDSANASSTTVEGFNRLRNFASLALGINIMPGLGWAQELVAVAERVREDLTRYEFGPDKLRIRRINDRASTSDIREHLGLLGNKYVLVEWQDINGNTHRELRTFGNSSLINHSHMAGAVGYNPRRDREYVVAAGAFSFDMVDNILEFDGSSMGFPTTKDSVDSGNESADGIPVVRQNGGINEVVKYLANLGVQARMRTEEK
ncbi:MAG: hypothetical protein HQM16_14370 [Deltaproteobacteria bacterium]|nr:hypothetical protein [Deltaproteobacteria bacterium]